ncbi:cysteine proteinase [Laetiporus sulphureus 93-53]|uniref:Ubiquitin carboxyl-terminal hydrolase n=1 Tax=Laetiporus sulphureus 93-53 TaxID=1314785 RepID=A0A165B0V4_9APHY|nr:cysteine proteinase [Laetiporus sulphureus 93-53]KZT00016.1 cysteine proteinase [Laetiporus sulphureus 93-53]
MAIGKWISFGSAQANHVSIPVAPAVTQPPVACAADAKQFGLENFGNTCYANSVLQALYFCGPFRELLVQYPDPAAPDIPHIPHPSSSLPTSNAAPSAIPRSRLERKSSVSESSPSQASQLNASFPRSDASSVFPIPPSPPTLLSALRSLFVHISNQPASKGTIAPRAFIEKLKQEHELFRSGQHQDAHEFLNFLLNRIVEEIEQDRRRGQNGTANAGSLSGEDLSTSIATLSTTAAGPTSTASISPSSPSFPQSTLVHRLFEGVLTSETRCLTCETVSSRDESFIDLSIDIEQNSSVTACLRQFSASEMLCQKNKFFCDACCDLQEAEKRMKIKKLPNILALHLKRFKYQEDVKRYIKLTYRVAFPLQLRLFNTVDDAENPDRLYELFAIVVHIGAGLNHGHYVTIIKARGKWLLFDDESVDVIKESDIPKYYGETNNGSAYVLYYQAVDLDMAALGIRPQEATTTSTDIGLEPSSRPSNVATVVESSESDPAVPPGLTVDADSEKSDSPLPTPRSQPQSSSSLQTPRHASPQPPTLGLSIPKRPSSGPSTPVQASGSSSSGALGGLFNTLRHTPSMRVRMNGGNASDSRRSWMDAVQHHPTSSPTKSRSSRRPATAHGIVSTTSSQSQESEPGSPSMASMPDGHAKEKQPEKKASMWFKRKSSRLEASFSGPSSVPVREDTVSPQRSQTLKETGHSRAMSEASPSPAPTSFAASPMGMVHSPLVPPPLASPSMPMSPVLSHPHHPEHKKSTPELPGKSKSSRSGVTSALGRLPRRPSTAGATVSTPSHARPTSVVVPPIPSIPSSPSSQQPNGTAGRTLLSGTPDAAHHRHSHLDEFGMHGFRRSHRPSTASAVPESPRATGFAASPSSSSVENGTKKRATRKLSFSAPMLGFGRKEKKDREVQPPPSSYVASR